MMENRSSSTLEWVKSVNTLAYPQPRGQRIVEAGREGGKVVETMNVTDVIQD